MAGATPDDDDLRHIALALRTEPGDLALNRAGKLSAAQARRLGVDEGASVEHTDGTAEVVGEDGDEAIAIGDRELADVGTHRGAFDGLALRVYFVAGGDTIVNAEPLPGVATKRSAPAPRAAAHTLDPDAVERKAMGELAKALLLFAVVPAFFALGMLYIGEGENVVPLFAIAGGFVAMGALALMRQLWVAWLSVVLFALMGLGVLVFVAAMSTDGFTSLSGREVGKVIFAYGAGALFVGVAIPYLIKVQVIDRVRAARRERQNKSSSDRS